MIQRRVLSIKKVSILYLTFLCLINLFSKIDARDNSIYRDIHPNLVIRYPKESFISEKGNLCSLWEYCPNLLIRKYKDNYVLYDGISTLAMLSVKDGTITSWSLTFPKQTNWVTPICLGLFIRDSEAYLIFDDGYINTLNLLVLVQCLEDKSPSRIIELGGLKDIGNGRYFAITENGIEFLVIDNMKSSTTLYCYSLQGDLIKKRYINLYPQECEDRRGDIKSIKTFYNLYERLYLLSDGSLCVSDITPDSEVFKFINESEKFIYGAVLFEDGLRIARWPKVGKKNNPEVYILKNVLNSFFEGTETLDGYMCDTWAMTPSDKDEFDVAVIKEKALEIWHIEF